MVWSGYGRILTLSRPGMTSGSTFLNESSSIFSMTLVCILIAARLTGYSAVCMMGLSTRTHWLGSIELANVPAHSSAARVTYSMSCKI